MSLRSFHYFFITMSVLLAAGFAAWGVADYRSRAELSSLVLGIGAIPVIVALVAYGSWARRKLGRLPILAVLLAIGARAADACPVCAGDPDSPLTKGAAAGVVFLVVVVSSLLAGIAFTAFTWARRAREIEAARNAPTS